jgi:choline dehydrogenase-like flavoprotein
VTARAFSSGAPIGMVAMLPGRPKINNWAFETVPQPGLGGRRGYQPRGRALGGSSAINAMLYVRGHPSDYDEWAKAGCDGWSWSDVLPVFRRSERNVRGSDGLHGEWVPCRWPSSATPRPISHAFVDAAASEVQIRRNDDFNGPEQEGRWPLSGHPVLAGWQAGRALLSGRRLSPPGDDQAQS